MGLFSSPEEKEAKKQEKLQKALEKYNLQELSDEKDIQSVRNIVLEMVGYGFFEAGALLGNDSAVLKQTAATNKAIMEQNFIIIRQLDRISKLLDRES